MRVVGSNTYLLPTFYICREVAILYNKSTILHNLRRCAYTVTVTTVSEYSQNVVVIHLMHTYCVRATVGV